MRPPPGCLETMECAPAAGLTSSILPLLCHGVSCSCVCTQGRTVGGPAFPACPPMALPTPGCPPAAPNSFWGRQSVPVCKAEEGCSQRLYLKRLFDRQRAPVTNTGDSGGKSPGSWLLMKQVRRSDLAPVHLLTSQRRSLSTRLGS